MIDQKAIVIAHGVLGSLAWVVFFPLGSVLVRVLDGPSSWKVHASIQVFAMVVFTAAVGTGLQMATRFRLLNNYHVIIGLLLFCLMFVQALGGWLHHIMFKKYQRRTVTTYVHLWLGRITITLGMINGGLGLLINWRTTRAQSIAYGTIAGLVWVGWLATSAIYERRRGESHSDPRRERRKVARERRVEQREAKVKSSNKQMIMGEKEDWA